MYVELQLAAPVYARLIQNQLRANQPCLSYLEFNVGGEVLVVDKIEIVDPTTILRDPGMPRQNLILSSLGGHIGQISVPYLQMKPTLSITLVKKSDLLSNDANPSSPAALIPGSPAGPISLQPVYDVSAFVTGDVGTGGPVELTYSLYDIDYGPLAALVPDDIKTAIQKMLAGFTLRPVTIDFSDLFDTLGQDATTVYNCGITCDANQTFVALRLEFQLETDSVAQFTSFFTTGPANRLQQGWDWAIFVDSRLLVQQATETIQTAMSKADGFKLTSGPDGSWNGSGIDISLRGTAQGACKATGGDIDMKAVVTFTSSVPSVNLVRAQLHLDVSSTNIFQVVECAAVAALLWPFLGLLMTGDDSLEDFAAYMGMLVIHPLLRMMVLIFTIETDGISDDLSSDLGKDWHKVDDDDYESDDALDSTKLQLPGLGGQLEFDGSTGAADGLIYGGRIPMQSYASGSVVGVTASPFAWRLTGSCQTFFTGTNYATISVEVNDPAKLCYAQLLGTSSGDYTHTQKDNTVTVTPVRHRTDLGKFVLPAEPCVVFVVTTDGVRIITFPPPLEETPDDIENIQKDTIFARGNCIRLTKLFTVLDKIHWVEQSTPEGSLQGWHVVVDNVHGQTVELQNQQGHLLLTGHATSMGVVQMILLLDEAHATKSMTIRLGGRAVEENATLKVSVQQVLFALRSSVNARDPLTQLSFSGARDAQLVALSPTQSVRWSLKTTGFPVLQQSIPNTTAISGALVHTGANISGVLSSKAQAALRSPWGRRHDYSVLGTPKVDGAGETLYLGSETKGTLWNISDPQKPVVLQVFHTAPWFVGTASSGRLLARRSGNSQLVNIYQAVAEHQL